MSEQNYPSYLIHYGIEGQKWGVRRFQNEDGTYTSEGLERRRSLIENHASKRDIRRATKEGNRQVQYNKMLASYQNKVNDKFNRVTERIKNDRKNGLNVSEKDIKKAIKLGTEVRKADYIAKDPQEYYLRQRRIQSGATGGAVPGTLAFGVLGGAATGIAVGAITAAASYGRYRKYYNDVFEKARNETIADLKKHKIIR